MAVVALAIVALLLTLALIIGAREFIRLRRYLAAVQHAATHDDLTGLLNRRSVNADLSTRLKASPHPVSVAVIDVDDLKGINDTYGHASGDQALRHIAARLHAAAAPHGHTVGRISGDEFVITVEGGIHAATTAAYAALKSLQSARLTIQGEPVDVTASIGVAVADDTADITELLTRADCAMYHAKREGRNGNVPVVTWTPDLHMPTRTDVRERRTYRGSTHRARR